MRKRRQEFNDRPEAINQFGQCMQLAQKAVDSFKAGDEKFNHLDAAEVEKVQKAIAEKQDWFNRMCADVSKMVSFPVSSNGSLSSHYYVTSVLHVLSRTRHQTPLCWPPSSTRRRSRSGTWRATSLTNPSLRWATFLKRFYHT